MKPVRLILVLALCLAVVAGVLWWRSDTGEFATPAECIDAFYDSGIRGDAGRHLRCLAEPLRPAPRSSDTEEVRGSLRSTMADLKSWAQVSNEQDGAAAIIEVEETRVHNRKRIRFRLVRNAGGWVISEIGMAEPLPTVVPYGTHEKELLPKS